MFKYASTLCGLFLVTALHANANPTTPLDPMLNQFMQAQHISKASVQWYAGGKLYRYQLGVNQQAIFELGGVGSLFTALNLAELVQTNQVKLTDLLPPHSTSFTELNLTQLSYGHLATYVPVTNTSAPIGSMWQESNLNFAILDSALEAITHQSLNQTYRANILAPLGMSPIGLNVPKAYLTQVVQGYNSTNQPVPASPGIKASGSDMQHFLKAALGLPGTPSQLAEAMRLTQTPFVQVGVWQQGLAWRINAPADLNATKPLPAQPLPPSKQSFNSANLMDQVGSTAGFTAYIAVIPNQQTGVVILVNKAIPTSTMVTLGRQILSANSAQ